MRIDLRYWREIAGEDFSSPMPRYDYMYLHLSIRLIKQDPPISWTDLRLSGVKDACKVSPPNDLTFINDLAFINDLEIRMLVSCPVAHARL